MAEELKRLKSMVQEVLRWSKQVDYLMGNHEDRYMRYVARNAPALLEVVQDFPTLAGLKQLDVAWTPYKKILTVGKAHFIHDPGSFGITAVRKAKADFQHNVFFGHTHRALVEYDGNVLGEKHVGMSLGWLGDADSVAVDYVPQSIKRHAWMSGFGVGHIERNGNVHMQFIPIVNNTCYVEGVRYAV
jgi:hypothetical protein